MNPQNEIPTGAKMIFFGVVALVILVIGIATWPLTVINETQKGLVLRNGALVRTLSPGMHFRMPLFEDVEKADLTVQTFTKTVPIYSKDSQVVDSTVTVNYRLDVALIEQAYRETQFAYEAKVISPNMTDVLEGSLSAFTANDLIIKRSTLGGVVKASLVEKLIDRPYIIIDTVSVTLDFDDAYEDAVKRKQVAEQEALTQTNITLQEEQKKLQEIKKAEALAERTRLEASALASQQGEKVIDKIYAEAALELAKKWNGSVPQTYIGGGEQAAGGMPPFLTFLNLNK